MKPRHNWFADAVRKDLERKAARGEIKLVEDGFDAFRRIVIFANANPAGRRHGLKGRRWKRGGSRPKDGRHA